jgi:hypothetical protein
MKIEMAELLLFGMVFERIGIREFSVMNKKIYNLRPDETLK